MTNSSGIGTPSWYEWEIGLIKCLEMLYDESIMSVVFQSSAFQSIDDVVVNYKDHSMINIQVKHTDVSANFNSLGKIYERTSFFKRRYFTG